MATDDDAMVANMRTRMQEISAEIDQIEAERAVAQENHEAALLAWTQSMSVTKQLLDTLRVESNTLAFLIDDLTNHDPNRKDSSIAVGG